MLETEIFDQCILGRVPMMFDLIEYAKLVIGQAGNENAASWVAGLDHWDEGDTLNRRYIRYCAILDMAKLSCFGCLNSHLMATNPTRRPLIPIFDNLKVSGALTTREFQRPSSVLPVEAIQRDYALSWQFLVSDDGVRVEGRWVKPVDYISTDILFSFSEFILVVYPNRLEIAIGKGGLQNLSHQLHPDA